MAGKNYRNSIMAEIHINYGKTSLHISCGIPLAPEWQRFPVQHFQKNIHRLTAQNLACNMSHSLSYTNPYTKNVTNLHNFYTK